MCVKCHTPRDQGGRLIRAEYLRGAPVPVKAPPSPNLKWAIKAPAIAGLPGYNKDHGVSLLTEGIMASGRVPDSPMPRFRLTPADARGRGRVFEIVAIATDILQNAKDEPIDSPDALAHFVC
jgi:hypothetical protein